MEQNYLNPLISVIIPAYKVARYIDECLESVVAQTHSDFEVIIVVGKSSDNTLKKCREWEERDRRIRVVLQDGKGLGSARNQGIRLAKADLIAFLDGDDWWAPAMLEKMYAKQREKNYSLVICDRINVVYHKNGTVKDSWRLKQAAMEYEASSVRENKWLINDIQISVNDKLYRKSIFYDYDIWQPDCYGEDRAIMHYLIAKCRSIGKVKEPLYFYRADRIGNSVNDPAVYKTTVDCMRHILSLFERDGIYEEFREQLNYIFSIVANTGINMLNRPAVGKDFAREEYIDKIRQFISEHVRQPRVSIVMPSYNVRGYIGKCLESVMSQTIYDIEIIVVDAFSTDGTREYVEKCMERDPRIRLIDDVKGSCGYAYNAGIDAALGEYIGFVETDDYVENDMFETLYTTAKEYDLDFVKSNFFHFIEDENGKEIKRWQKVLPWFFWQFYNQVIDKNQLPELPIYDGQIWTGIYRRTWLKENNIRLNESKGAAFQDHGFLWQAMGRANTGMYLDRFFYHYRKDNAGASMKNTRAMLIDLKELYFIEKQIDSLIEEEPDWGRAFYRKLVGIVHYRLGQYIMVGGSRTREIMECLSGFKALINKGQDRGLFDEQLLDAWDLADWKLMEKSMEGYYDYMEVMANSIKNRLNEIIKKAEKAKEIVVVGQGDNGILLYWILASHGLSGKIVTYADNNPRKMGDELDAFVDSIDIKRATRRHRRALYFLCNRDYATEIYRQLQHEGISKDNIYIYKNAFPGWAVWL